MAQNHGEGHDEPFQVRGGSSMHGSISAAIARGAETRSVPVGTYVRDFVEFFSSRRIVFGTARDQQQGITYRKGDPSKRVWSSWLRSDLYETHHDAFSGGSKVYVLAGPEGSKPIPLGRLDTHAFTALAHGKYASFGFPGALKTGSNWIQ